MTKNDTFDIFLVTLPGLEKALLGEVRAKGFNDPKLEKGGITLHGNWQDVWRANLVLRGASKVLARIGAFPVMHLAQLDKRAKKFPWDQFLRPDVSVRIEVTCKKSKVYHQRAAAQRIETAISQTLGAPISSEGEVCLKVRIIDDICTISIDTSGDGLHKRGHKEALNKAPMRETIASLLLRQCGYDATRPLIDPMCGSGTFVIEAAEIAIGLNPGRTRDFAFQQLATFDPAKWQSLKEAEEVSRPCELTFYGFDRDKGAIDRALKNAERAGLTQITSFQQQTISDLRPPQDGPKGLVIINPPYGIRIGDTKKLVNLYAKMGETLRTRFAGWQVGLVTNQEKLAQSTGLPFGPKPVAFSHGGIAVKLYRTFALPDPKDQ